MVFAHFDQHPVSAIITFLYSNFRDMFIISCFPYFFSIVYTTDLFLFDPFSTIPRVLHSAAFTGGAFGMEMGARFRVVYIGKGRLAPGAGRT
jgi:hypothetical protein